MWQTRRHPPFALAYILLLAVVHCVAQTGDPMISGSVSDTAGARLPNVALHITHKSSARGWDVTSDRDGVFQLTNIPPGAYRVEISHPGFTTKLIDEVLVGPNLSPVLAEQLAAASVAEQVNVAADMQLLQSETSTLTATLSSKTLVALPTASRNYTHLIVTQPGVAAPLPDRTGAGLNIATTPGAQAEDATQSLNPSVNGARPTNNALRINGIDATNLLNQGGGLGNNINVPLDAVEAIEVQSALYSAATGRNGGGNVEMVTKSGTNDFHGSAFHFFQNEKFNANEFFLNRAGTPRPQFRRNETGVTIGGPVWRDRTFFFASLQRTDFVSGYASNGIAATGLPVGLTDVRTPESIAQVANNYLLNAAADDPRFAQNFLNALRAFPADQQAGLISKFFANPAGLQLRTLTPADIHPVAIRILNTKRDGRLLIPSPGAELPVLPGNGTYGREHLLQQVIPTKFNSWNGSGSIQHNTAANNRTRLNYIGSRQLVEEAFGWADASPSPTLGDNSSFLASLSNEHTLSATWVNNFRIGFFDLKNTRVSKYRDIKNSDLGIFNPLEQALGGLAALMPTIDINTQRNSGGIGNAWDFYDRQKVINVGDNVSYVRDAHSTQFGGEYRRMNITGEYMSRNNGDLDYDNWIFFFTGHGAAGGGSDLDQGDTRRNFTANDFSLFVHDDWKALPGLTVNFGLRYDFYGNLTEKDGRLGNYYTDDAARRLGVSPGFQVPANSIIFAPGFNPLQIGLVVDPSTPVDLSMIHRAKHASTLLGDYNNFAPRIGFAWQPQRLPQFVLRGGYGIYYERASASYKVDLQRAAPFFIYQNVPAPADMADPYPRLNVNPFQIPLDVRIVRNANGTPSWVRADGTAFPAQSPFSAKNNVFIDPFIRTPYTQQWSLNTQYEPTKDIVVDARYVGSHGVGLLGRINLAQPVDPRLTPVNGFTDIYDRAGRLINPDFFVAPEYLGLNRNGGFAQLGNWAQSNYHALQLQTRGRLRANATWNIAYTFSKSLDNMSSDASLAEHDARDLAGNRGLSDFDRAHRLTATYVVEVPTLWRGNSVGRQLTGGWTLSGLVTVQSGTPFSALGNATRNAVFAQPARVRLDFAPGRNIEDAQLSGRVQDRLNAYYDVTAFQDSLDRWGNSGRNILRGPRQSQFDFSLGKITKLSEQTRIEFRWEIYNAFNTPIFANPDSLFAANGYGNAGRITRTIGGPRTMQAALKLQF